MAWLLACCGRFQQLIWLGVALLAIIMLVTIAVAMQRPASTPNLRAEIQQLRQQQRTGEEKLAEAEALLAMRDSQIAAMQQQFADQQQQIEQLQARLALFNDVLAGRKVAGIHFLHAKASWQGQSIRYRLAIVKGKSYPRWVIGRLQFTLSDKADHQIILQPPKAKNSGYKIEMQEQAFIEGQLTWQQDWPPTQMTITLIDHAKHARGHITIPVIAVSPTTNTRSQP